ncbi:MAG: hypothetical protein JSR17_06705 [Proteobacteria bacterium]|nr:hypothetical protein [Pseudomonadota bacterium]
MREWSLALTLLIVTPFALANELSDECMKSMQNVYKFYYHEILPKENSNKPDKLGTLEAVQMQEVIGNLKTNCSTETVAQMNKLLQSEDVKQG